MPPQRHSSEQIITKRREAKFHLAKGMMIPLMFQKLFTLHQQIICW